MDLVFRAVSDPTRRAILDLLAEGERAVNELLSHFSFSQPALSKHLKVLREAGLVVKRAVGRQRLYSLEAQGLRSVAEWVAHYERFWSAKLDALGDVLDAMPGDARPGAPEQTATRVGRKQPQRNDGPGVAGDGGAGR